MSADIRATLKEVLLGAKAKLRKQRGKSYGEKNAKASSGKDSGADIAGLGSSAGLDLSKGPNPGSKEVAAADKEVRTEMALGGAGLLDEMKDFMSNKVRRPLKKTAKGKPAIMIINEAKNPNKKGK